MIRLTRACLASAMVVAAACRVTHERERVDFERMRVQQRDVLYGASSQLPGGMDMQAPPSGTVSREAATQLAAFVPAAATATPSPSAALTTIPIAVTPRLLARGKNRFGIYCAVCHGMGGFGGSIVAENMGPPRPPSFHAARLLAVPDGYIFGVATNGLGRMPSYAAELSPEDRWAVVAYIRQLQQRGATTPEERVDSLRAIQIHMIDSLAEARRAR